MSRSLREHPYFKQAGLMLQALPAVGEESCFALKVDLVSSSLTNEEREFLLALKKGEPRWDLLGVPGIERLPAIQWRLMNIKKMKTEHHRKSVERLRAILKL